MLAKNVVVGSCLALVLLACSGHTPRPPIPAYPNQSNLTITITPGAGYDGETIAFLTTDAELDIKAYYARAAPEAGWSVSGYNWENGQADDGFHYDSVHGCPIYYLAIRVVPASGPTTVVIETRTYPCT